MNSFQSMDDNKSRLNELCQKLHLPLPNYFVRQSLSENNQLVFMAHVDVKGDRFESKEMFKRKKEAENAAAAVALQQIVTNTEADLIRNHLPEQYSEIERFFVDMIKPLGGRIRKACFHKRSNIFNLEISGGYRYCNNVQRNHQHNQIYFIVHPDRMIYFQRCHDPVCLGFQSAAKPIVVDRHNDSTNQS